ncbi:MAG TPA: hypothetical protein VMX35_03580 [Acidobacteriota bacterium]|nr:hypothetical protein [Acidobacteriota bacterium]
MKTKLGESLIEQAVDIGAIPSVEEIQLECTGGPDISEVHTLLYCANSIFMSDEFNHRVVCFDRKGRLIRVLGGEGDEPGKLRYPKGLAVLGGNLWVCDSLNHRIQIFDMRGELQRTLRGTGSLPKFYEPVDVRVIDSFAHVVSKRTSELAVLDEEGNKLASWAGRPDENQVELSKRMSFDEAVYSVAPPTQSHSRALAWWQLRQVVFSRGLFWGLCGDRLEVHDAFGSLVTGWDFPPLVGERGLSAAGREVVYLEETTGCLALFNLVSGGALFSQDSRFNGCGTFDDKHIAALTGNRILLWPVETLHKAGRFSGQISSSADKAKIHLATGSFKEAALELERVFSSGESIDFSEVADPARWYFKQTPKQNKRNLLEFIARRIRHLARILSQAVAGVLDVDKIYSTLLSPKNAYLTVIPYRNATLPAWLLTNRVQEETARAYAAMRSLTEMKQLFLFTLKQYSGEQIKETVNTLGEGFTDLIEIAELVTSAKSRAFEKAADLSVGFPYSTDESLSSLSDECAKFTFCSQTAGFIAGFSQELWSRLPDNHKTGMPASMTALFDRAREFSCSIECCLAFKGCFDSGELETGAGSKSLADRVLDELADSIVEVCDLAEKLFEAKRPQDVDLTPLVRASWRHNKLIDELRSAGHFEIPEMVKPTAIGGAAQLRTIGRESFLARLAPHLPVTDVEKKAVSPPKDEEHFRAALESRAPLLLDGKRKIKELSTALLEASGAEEHSLLDAVIDLVYVLPFPRHQGLLRDVFKRLQKKSNCEQVQLRIASLGSALAWHGGDKDEAARWEKQGLELDRRAALSRLGDDFYSLGHGEKASHYFLSEYLSTLSTSARLAELLSLGQLSPGELAAFLLSNRHRIGTDSLYQLCNCGLSDWRQLDAVRQEFLARLEVETSGGHAESRKYLAYLSAFGGYAENEEIYQRLSESDGASPALPLEHARNAAGCGNPQYALELLDRFEREHEVTLPSLNLKSICAKLIGDFQLSESAALARVDLGEHTDTVVLNRALICLWKGEPQKALGLAESIPADSPFRLQREFVLNSALFTMSEFEAVVSGLPKLAFHFKRNSHLLWFYVLAMEMMGDDNGYNGGIASLFGLRGLHIQREACSAFRAFSDGKKEGARRLAALALHRNPSLSVHFLAPLLIDSFNSQPPQKDDISAIENLAERFPAMVSVRDLGEAVKAWSDKSLWAKLVRGAEPAENREKALYSSLLGQVAINHHEFETARHLLEPLRGRFWLFKVEENLARIEKPPER